MLGERVDLGGHPVICFCLRPRLNPSYHAVRACQTDSDAANARGEEGGKYRIVPVEAVH